MEFTQSAIVLENLISKFLFSKAAEKQGGSNGGGIETMTGRCRRALRYS